MRPAHQKKLWGPFPVNGSKPICYTKVYELVGKGVGIGLVGLHCRPTCVQAKHAQYVDGMEIVQ